MSVCLLTVRWGRGDGREWRMGRGKVIDEESWIKWDCLAIVPTV